MVGHPSDAKEEDKKEVGDTSHAKEEDMKEVGDTSDAKEEEDKKEVGEQPAPAGNEGEQPAPAGNEGEQPAPAGNEGEQDSSSSSSSSGSSSESDEKNTPEKKRNKRVKTKKPAGNMVGHPSDAEEEERKGVDATPDAKEQEKKEVGSASGYKDPQSDDEHSKSGDEDDETPFRKAMKESEREDRQAKRAKAYEAAREAKEAEARAQADKAELERKKHEDAALPPPDDFSRLMEAGPTLPDRKRRYRFRSTEEDYAEMAARADEAKSKGKKFKDKRPKVLKRKNTNHHKAVKTVRAIFNLEGNYAIEKGEWNGLAQWLMEKNLADENYLDKEEHRQVVQKRTKNIKTLKKKSTCFTDAEKEDWCVRLVLAVRAKEEREESMNIKEVKQKMATPEVKPKMATLEAEISKLRAERKSEPKRKASKAGNAEEPKRQKPNLLKAFFASSA